MWCSVAPDDIKSAAPSARAKHTATVIGDHVYLLGGRNGNLPTRDFWKYNLVSGKWQQLKPTGDKLPCLQEHTAVAYRDTLYVFGGEVGFSAGTETPLWLYDIKENTWKKLRTKKGVASPKGRRGHTALIHKGSMLIYGGYQDLRGSSSELWAYHFETESWHLISSTGKSSSNNDQLPAPRHKHSAILSGDEMWIYGGMTDLQERSDLWKWDISTRKWFNIKTKLNPGPLHSHAACKMPSCMLVFGGERSGQTCNDLWKFHFGMECWEKITISGLKPQPRAESIAFTVSELLLNGTTTTTSTCTSTTLESKATRIRRNCSSADRGNRHSSYLPNNRVAPSEKTYIFQQSNDNYTDGSEDAGVIVAEEKVPMNLAQQHSENRASRSILQEISKLSQINITRISNKCNYTVLKGTTTTDSTENLLKQHASPKEIEIDYSEAEIESTTPTRSAMVKSKSAHVLKKKYQMDVSPGPGEDLSNKDYSSRKNVEFESTIKIIPREPISVPNFSALTLPTPVLTPVEATKLVYLTDEEPDLDNEPSTPPEQLQNNLNIYENYKPVHRGESYSSHLGYADNPLYQQMVGSVQEKSAENVSSTSDYASIETVNRLSQASSYSIKTATPQEENKRNRDKDNDGPFGFCNPNYMGPDIKAILAGDDHKKNAVKAFGPPVKSPNHNKSFDEGTEDELEMQTCNGVIDMNTKVLYRHSSRINRPPKSLALDNEYECKMRAVSASRAERNKNPEKIEATRKIYQPVDIPLYVYVIGGKEQGQVTVFKRPISIWKLKLF